LNFNVIKNVHWLANNNNAPIFIVRLQLENRLWEIYLQIESRVCLLMCSISDTNFFLYWDSSSKIATFSQSNSWSSSNQSSVMTECVVPSNMIPVLSYSHLQLSSYLLYSSHRNLCNKSCTPHQISFHVEGKPFVPWWIRAT